MRIRPASRAARPPLPILAALVLVVSVTGASGSVVRVLSLPQLAERSDAVVVAAVESSSASWVDGRIVTDSVVAVGEPLSGAAAGDRLVVRTLGGEVDGIGQRVFGEPWLRAGERYLLFLESLCPEGEPCGTARYRTIGMSQGALPVVDGSDGPRVVPSPELPELVEPGAERTVQAWLAAPRPLADVLTDVRAALRDAGH